MRDLIATLVISVGCLVGLVLVIMSATYIHSQWNCRTWHHQTGDKTKVVGTECYVRKGDHWEDFDVYVEGYPHSKQEE